MFTRAQSLMRKNSTIEQRHFENLKKGSEKAFEYFFDKYYGHILGFCLQFLYSKPHAKGVVQDAFLHLWVNRAQVEKASGVKSFLYTFAKSKCLNAIRHQKIRENYWNAKLNEKERLLNLEILNSMRFDSMSLSELEQLIDDSIRELPSRTKVIFRKKRFENKKNKEIAEELDITLKAVEAHVTKALKILRFKLSDYLPILLLIQTLTQ